MPVAPRMPTLRRSICLKNTADPPRSAQNRVPMIATDSSSLWWGYSLPRYAMRLPHLSPHRTVLTLHRRPRPVDREAVLATDVRVPLAYPRIHIERVVTRVIHRQRLLRTTPDELKCQARIRP